MSDRSVFILDFLRVILAVALVIAVVVESPPWLVFALLTLVMLGLLWSALRRRKSYS